MPYEIVFTPEAARHVDGLRAHDRARLLTAVGRQLRDEPTSPTRHRTRMRPNTLAQYRLRVGNLRVYYDVREQPHPLVLVKGVGVKVRERVRLGGEEIEL